IMRNLAKDQGARDPDGRVLGRALIEAAKASGMSPDELIVRSGLLTGRQSGAMQLPPMQRTKQLELTTELAERLAAGPTSAGNGTTPGDKPHFPAPSAPTTKWTPPPGFQALLTPPRPPMPSEPRAVDETLDDESAPIIKAPPSEPLPSVPKSAPVSAKVPASRPPSGPMLSAPTGEASPVSVPRERTPVPRTAPGEPFHPSVPNPRDVPTAPPTR